MSTSNFSASFGGNGDTTMGSCELQNTAPRENSYTDIHLEPLDLTVDVNRDSETCASFPLTFQKRTSTFLNAPQSTSFKSVSSPIAEVKPFSSPISKAHDLSKNSIEKPQSPASDQPMEIAAADSTIEESKSRVAVSFLVKKSRGFYGSIRFYLPKPSATNSSKFQSLVTSLKDSVKSTLAKTMPSSKTISQITNSLVNKLKGKRISDCLRFLRFSLTPFNKRKKQKASENVATMSMQQGSSKSGTFLNPVKKPELQHLPEFPFVKPRFYECSYCDTRFYKLPIYIKHIRRHAEIIRCDTCCKAFSSVINKRRHQLQCRQRTVV